MDGSYAEPNAAAQRACKKEDVGDWKQTELRLKAELRELRQLIDLLPQHVLVLDSAGRLLQANQTMLEYSGHTLEEMEDATDVRIKRDLHPDDQERVQHERRSGLAAGVPFEIEKRMLSKTGQYRWFLFRYKPVLNEDSRVVRWFATATDIEDRKRVEESLRSSELKLQRVIDTIPALAWCNLPDGTNEFLNKSWHEYTGLSPDESHGWGWQAAFHPEDLPPLMEKWVKMLTSGEPGEIEARLRRHDGVYRWFLIRAEPFRDDADQIIRWYGTSTDIDDRKHAEEQLRRSQAFLAEGQLLSLTGSFSWKMATGEITWSEQLYRLYEFETGMPVTFELIRTRVHPEDLTLLEKMVEQARKGESNFEWHYRLVMPDRSIKYLHAVAHARRDQNGHLEYIATVQDVTQRRVSEESLAKARLELTQLARVMTLATLTASIAHEVNQPLSGIVTNASTCLRMLASDPPNVDGARETARRTIRDGNRASEVITRLRALFSKKDATLEPLDLNDAVREVIALCLSELQRNRIVIRSELANDLPVVMGDRVQLQQVILNLLRNGSEAMRDVEDRPRELVIATTLDGRESVRLTVKDAGVGFGPEVVDKLFQAFYTTKADGMGIGLSISRSIIDNHHGRLWATPNDGSGATFCFSVPCASAVGAKKEAESCSADAA